MIDKATCFVWYSEMGFGKMSGNKNMGKITVRKPDVLSVAMRILVVVCFGLFQPLWGQSSNLQVRTVNAGDNQGLIMAIQAGNMFSGITIIRVIPNANGGTEFNFEQPFNNSMNALPPITGTIEITTESSSRVSFVANNEGFRFAEITGRGSLSLDEVNVETFSKQDSGGVILARDNSFFSARDVSFRNNFSGGEGGVVFAQDNATTIFRDSRLSGNRAATISLTGMSRGLIFGSAFSGNDAGVFGCDINVNSASSGPLNFSFFLEDSSFDGTCSNVSIENPFGTMSIRNNTFAGQGDAIDSTAFVQLFGNLFGVDPSTNLPVAKATCNDFGSGAFNSDGYNLLRFDDCFATEPTDQVNTDPMLGQPDDNGVRGLNPGSPAIDAAAALLTDLGDTKPVLPCGYKDSRGLGRPQDANGDGVFECDIGSFEVQGGDDLLSAQSGAYFDPDRSGEGVFLEMLGNDQALVAVFTYTADGELAWFVGIDQVQGNSVVIDELLITEGGVFGAGFDPNAIARSPVGSMSLVFPNCLADASPGQMAFQAASESDFEDLLVKSTRLSSVLNCDGSAAPALSGRSGSFFDPARDGEGIFVQWLPDGRVVLIWYTYTPDGQQFWTISENVTIDGNTITANMLYPENTTRFGSEFDPAEINLQPWGTVTAEYQPGCNNLNFSYDSTVSGFGNGSYSYSRISTIDGSQCDL